ncbi:hypothetical protein [Alkalihalobacillus sp. BA299]|uniref:hypothetical protein n=1 Tax=Alkalihalobacillus sp. BA299 TaxID=2815938 RepID=UPI001ADBC4EE|nr:hypothetical protein [Alkalihalobacillus sp. BA299]
MLLIFPSWLFTLIGILLVGIICAVFSLLITKWMKKKKIKDKRFENIVAFFIVIVVVAAAMFMKENLFTTVYEGSLIVTEEQEVEVPYTSAEFFTFQDVLIIDYLFTQMNYGEEFNLNNNNEDASVRVSIAINEYQPLLSYMKKYKEEESERYLNQHFPFDVYYKREHSNEINHILQQLDSNQSCENLLPTLEEELVKREKDYFHYEIVCIE